MDFIPAKNHGPAGANFPIMRVVMHGTVSPCVPGGARDIARMFANTNRDASTQYVVDPGEVIQCVRDDTIAYGAPPNKGSIHVEQCDPQGGSPSRWQDANHQSMLRLAAQLVARICLKYDIPIRKIGPTDLLAGRKGICGHKDVSDAWHQTDHVDPGPDYPWDQFISLVQQYAHPAPPKVVGDRMYTLWKVKDQAANFASDGMHAFWLRDQDHRTAFQYQMTRFYGSADTTVYEYDADQTFYFMPGGFVGPVPPGWTLSADLLTLSPPA